MLPTFLAIAIGSALGGCLRFAATLALQPTRQGFPLGILSVNLLGSFLMGVFVVLSAHRGAGPLAPLIAVGFLGSFTTFSTFSLEAVTLAQRGQFGAAVVYVLLSVAGAIVALLAGMGVAKITAAP